MSNKKAFFDPVDPRPNFPQLEMSLLDYWYESGIVRKYILKNRNSKKRFSFLDGPITANNPMGVHHAWGRTYKDLWQRFYNMNGFRQRFHNGFDCQGLWVEVEVEKELGLKSKKDIENLVAGNVYASIAKFVELCKERVFKYARIQTEQSKRLGYFMDWDNSYYTLSDDNNYMIWHFLKKCHEMGLIYKGRDSVPWCPRCGTAISQHEILTEDYKELTHDSIFVRYPVEGEKDKFLLVWTTTLWTLPGNVAVAVDPRGIYVEAKDPSDKDKKYYLNKFAAERLGFLIEKEFKGEELIGKTYKSPFDGFEQVKKSLGNYSHKVLATDERILPISIEEGTGLVHIAPGAGSEDFQLAQEFDIPVIELIKEDATYVEGLGEFSGKNAKDHPEIMIDFLENFSGGVFLYKIVPYTHRYPVCWRCKEELVWRVVDEWYIAMDKVFTNQKSKGENKDLTLRKQMIEIAKKIRWIPEFGLDREIDWLENMHDWLISKKRYWGLALPIWECKSCQNFEVIGGKRELRERSVEGWERFKGHSPHRPWIDEVKIRCTKCGSVSERIPDVGNPWLDAGIVPFSTITQDNKGAPLYWKKRSEWQKWFPADFITESFPGQFKNWFYSLIAMSTVLENREPFKTVLGFATLLAEDGRPMHKSLGNMIEFNEGANKIGVDVMRWMYVRQNPSDNLLFGYRRADEVRKFHLKLWNVYNFFVTRANLDGWSPKKKFLYSKVPDSALDAWIVSRLKKTLDKVAECLYDYNAYSASYSIEEFVDDLSNWYIRRSRERTGFIARSKSDKESFYKTCYFVLVTLSKILAPFTPFVSDYIYRNLTKRESVHLEDWPTISRKFINEDLEEQMVLGRRIVEVGHSLRKELGIPVKRPIRLAWHIEPGGKLINPFVLSLVKDELNIKEWISQSMFEKFSKKGDVKNKTSDDGFAIFLDTSFNKELEEETKTRELIRKIQQKRKEMGVKITQRIDVTTPWLPTGKKLIQKIKRTTIARRLQLGDFKVEIAD